MIPTEKSRQRRHSDHAQVSLTGLKLGRGFPETVVVLRRKIYRVATVGARTSCLVCHAFRSYHKRQGKFIRADPSAPAVGGRGSTMCKSSRPRQITPGVL